MASILNTPFAHDKRVCILIPDEIGPEPPADESVLIARATRDRNSVWVREPAIVEVRESDRSANVYGFWQALIASNAVDMSQSLSVYYTGERAGLYLLCESGFAVRSGRFSGGRLPFDLSAEHSLDSAVSVTVDLEALTPPGEYARLPSEIISERDKAQRSAMLTGFLVGVVIFVVAAAYGWQRAQAYQIRADRMRSIKTQQAAVRNTITELKHTHRSSNDTITLQQQSAAYLLDLVEHSGSIRVTGAAMDTGQFVARVTGLTNNPAWATEIAALANGDYAVSYGGASVSELPRE